MNVPSQRASTWVFSGLCPFRGTQRSPADLGCGFVAATIVGRTHWLDSGNFLGFERPAGPDLFEYTFLEMVRMKIFGILAGNED